MKYQDYLLMSIETKNKIVPKLRFPEFKEALEWEEKQFGEICKFIRGPFGGALKKEIFVKNGYAVYEQSHAIYNSFDSFRYYITEEKFNELKRFEVLPNDIIMSCSGTMGKFAIVPIGSKKGVINQALLKLTVKTGNDLRFIKETLELPIIQEKLLSQSAGGAIKNVVEVSQIKEIILNIPTPKEQQKIADCLFSLDDLIIAENQKLIALKDHKKGLMQQLFPAEGEMVPKLRFVEFKESGDWKKKEFNEILEITRLAGYEYSEYWEEDPNKEIIALRGYNIGKGKLVLINLGYISNSLSLKLIRSRLFYGDIVYPCVGTIGNAVVIEEDNKYHIQQNIAKLTPKEGTSPYFICQFLMSDLGMNEVYRFNATSSQPNVLVGSLRKFEVPIPAYEEQQKIADCLSSLDELITKQTEKIEELKYHKKGLMQGVFPSTN